ncbi:MAG: cell division protein, partial [Bifidobacterium crudilactis]|nr:cell division protein [Bifidobacterium crudilactis]
MADNFPIALRGYDKERVDAALSGLQENIARLREQRRAYDERVLKLEAELQEEKARKSKGSKDSFASLGANAQQLLASAEQTSTELLNRAKQD